MTAYPFTQSTLPGEAFIGDRVRLSTHGVPELPATRANMPLVIGVIANFSARPADGGAQQLCFDDLAAYRDLDGWMAHIAPRLTLTLQPPHLEKAQSLIFAPERLADFHPQRIAATVEPLRPLAERRAALCHLREGTALTASTTEMDFEIGRLDQELGYWLEAILHHPAFQKLEAAWRSLAYLLQAAGRDGSVRIHCMDCHVDDLQVDLCGPYQGPTHADAISANERERHLRQSYLYKALYETGLGQSGGDSYGLLICDHPFGPGDADMLLLDQIGRVASQTFTLFAASAAPSLLGCDNFAEIGDQGGLPASPTGEHFEAWARLRMQPHAQNLALALPRVVLRAPYGLPGAEPASCFYAETCAVLEDWLWMSAAFPLAARAITAFRRYGWCAAMTGLGPGGRLPPPVSLHHEGGLGTPRPPLELVVTPEQAQALSAMGLAVLVDCHLDPHLAFLSAPSLAGSASTVPHILCAGRFGHLIKHILRELIGKSWTIERVENELNRWLQQYIAHPDNASPDMRAARPLHSGRIEMITDGDTGPDRFQAHVTLGLHYQFNPYDPPVRLGLRL
ncbi:type VI secretion system contractile sheath domain-containing protein [Niveispirillum irakense]|uniref:type VI secretion system contractile sheath domain-containing protein n=1 Tax=Niveispirillum irakense TaxID=34011 RepID=UPI0004240110|nr:type VI secretion system contractile sheath large subunit [Niveispirillum irakense]